MAEERKKALQSVLERYGDTQISALSDDIVKSGEQVIESILEQHGNKPIKTLYASTFKDELQDAFPVLNDEIDTSFPVLLPYRKDIYLCGNV